MNISPKIIAATVALGLCLAVTPLYAQDSMTPASSSSSMGSTHGRMMHHKMMNKKMMNGSMHMMPATVKSVDTTTGIVEVDAERMALTVHFPAASVANLKAGDKITLHMGFSKP